MLYIVALTEAMQLFDNDVDKTTNAFFDDEGTLLKKVWNIKLGLFRSNHSDEGCATRGRRMFGMRVTFTRTMWASKPVSHFSCASGCFGIFAWAEDRFTGFAVHHQDSLRPGLFDNLAPSRPPSRNSVNLNDGYIAGTGGLPCL